jgi:hypothetical protein
MTSAMIEVVRHASGIILNRHVALDDEPADFE